MKRSGGGLAPPERFGYIKSPLRYLSGLLILFFLMLLLPELIVCGFDLSHFAGGDENRAFANVGYAVSETLQIMSHPQQPICAFDGLGILNDEHH